MRFSVLSLMALLLLCPVFAAEQGQVRVEDKVNPSAAANVPFSSREGGLPTSAREVWVTAPFDDPEREWSLPELVDTALRRNPATTVAWQQANAQAAQLGVLKADNLPTVNVGVQGGGVHTTQPTAASRNTVNQLFIGPVVQMQYLLLDFGARRASQEQARFNLLSQNFGFNKALQDVTLNVTYAYYNLDGTNVQLENAKTALALAEAMLEQTQVRVKAGLATATDLASAQQNAAQFRYNLEGALGNVSTARVALATSLGVPGNTPLKIAAPTGMPATEVLSTEVDKLIDLAFQQRPDLAAKYNSWRAQLAATDAAEANRWPALTMNVGLQRSYYATDKSPPNGVDHQDNAQAVLSFSFDIFDGGRKSYQVKSAKAQAAAMRADLQAGQLGAVADVVTGFVVFKTAAKQVEAAQALLDASQKSFDSTNIAYKSGLKNMIDLLTAQNNLAGARATLATARTDLFNASAGLANATGSLLSVPAGR